MLRFPVLLTSAKVGLIMSATSWRGVCTQTTILRQDSTAVCRFGSERKKEKLRIHVSRRLGMKAPTGRELQNGTIRDTRQTLLELK